MIRAFASTGLFVVLTGLGCREGTTSTRFLDREGVELWVKESGLETGKPIVFLHGGPGDNAYVFERAVGDRLETRLRMIYFDQRGAGRSSLVDEDLLGIQDLIADIEHIRSELGYEKVSLIGHSFGGALAVEYARRFPDRVDRIVFIDSTANFSAMRAYQADFIVNNAEALYPEYKDVLAQITQSEAALLEKYGRIYSLLGAKSLYRALYFEDARGFAAFDRLSRESGIRGRSRGRVANRLLADHYLDSSHPELMVRLSVPSAMFAGRASHVAGEMLIEAAANAWGAKLTWFEKSGHMPYLDEPEAFTRAAFDFLDTH